MLILPDSYMIMKMKFILYYYLLKIVHNKINLIFILFNISK